MVRQDRSTTTSSGDVLTWLKANHGAESQWPFFDQIGVHVYNDFRNNWDGPQPYNQELIGKVAHFRGNQLFRVGQFDLAGMPVDVSEVSLPSLPSDEFTDRSETLQAVYPGQVLARAMVAGAARAIWFSAEDNFTGACDNPYAWFTFGLLRSQPVYQAAQGCGLNPLPGYTVSVPHEPKPALTALGVAVEQLGGRYVPRSARPVPDWQQPDRGAPLQPRRQRGHRCLHR